MYQVMVRWAPAHELVASLGLYLERKGHKLTELGPAWAIQVKRQLDPSFAQLLAKGVPVDGGMLHFLIEQHPNQPDGPTFLAWLAAMAPGEFYERAAPFITNSAPPLPADLAAYRDQVVEIHTRWHEQYFTKLDPAILNGLAAEAARRAQAVAEQSPTEAVEVATNGIVLGPDAGFEQVVLIPSYHGRPANRLIATKQIALFFYAYDEPGSDLPLLRTLRALPDESRIRILRFIRTEEHSFMEIARHTGLALSTVHHHLVTLRAAGLVRVHDAHPRPAASGQSTARYSFRPAVLEGLGQRLITMIDEGESA